MSVDKEALMRRAVGRPFEVDWVGASMWTRRSAVAECYSKGRVLLAGDAVHQLSPTGALGMNTGHRRRGRSRLEARGRDQKLGRAETLGQLRHRASASRASQRCNDHPFFFGTRRICGRACRD